MNIAGGISPFTSTRLYGIQVGAYRETANAEKAFNSLREAGLNPVYVNHNGLKRVIVPGIRARHIRLLLDVIRSAGFNSVWLEEDSTRVSVVVRGNAAVSQINASNREPMAIVQTIPSFSSSGTHTYQANAPIVFFFNGKIYLDSVDGNIDVAVDGRKVNGTAVINEGANGYAVLTFTPSEPFPAGKEISVTVKKEVRNDGGNQMQNDISLSYTAEQGSDTDFSSINFGFESGANGVVFTGDGAISTGRRSLAPYEGSRYAAISTGTGIVSDKEAINGRTSQIQLGPVRQPFSTLDFYYDFISAEFNEYVGTEFDDTAMVTVYGPNGSHSEIITSVNKIRYNNTGFTNYPGMPDDGDSYAGHTGWLYHSIENINVGNPAYIIFSVTDVGDLIYSSILAVDAVELK
jgi:hypothetical protein